MTLSSVLSASNMRRWPIRALSFSLVLCASMALVIPAYGHGFVGKRFFPATLATDDPFIADELSLPTISYFKTPANGDEPVTRQTDFSLDVSKRTHTKRSCRWASTGT